jgi:hypothetical protein
MACQVPSCGSLWVSVLQCKLTLILQSNVITFHPPQLHCDGTSLLKKQPLVTLFNTGHNLRLDAAQS